MAHLDEARARRVVSRDGTEIAYWTSGEGPPLVAVHGTPADHTRWRPLLPYLEPHVSVHAHGQARSRRQRRRPHVRPVTRVRGRRRSARGGCGGLRISGRRVRSLPRRDCGVRSGDADAEHPQAVLYEGWLVPNPDVYALPPGHQERMDALLAEGVRDAVVETLFREQESMSDEDMEAF